MKKLGITPVGNRVIVEQDKVETTTDSGIILQLENEAAQKYFVGNAQILKKLEVTNDSLKHNAKVVIPAGSELINVIGDLAGVLPIKNK